MTIHGKTMAEMLKDVPDEPRADQDVIRPWSKPMYKQGHLAILKGNLATEGCVAKITGLKNPSITGPARVFDSENACMKAIMAKRIKPGDVIVIRYEGPKGGPGHAGDARADLGADRPGAGRIGGPAHRRALLRRHLGHGGRPRRARKPTSAAPIALVKEGDSITIDAKKRLHPAQRAGEGARRAPQEVEAAEAALHARACWRST